MMRGIMTEIAFELPEIHEDRKTDKSLVNIADNLFNKNKINTEDLHCVIKNAKCFSQKLRALYFLSETNNLPYIDTIQETIREAIKSIKKSPNFFTYTQKQLQTLNNELMKAVHPSDDAYEKYEKNALAYINKLTSIC